MADQLIPIIESTVSDAVVQTVNARDLHTFLGVGKRFTTWISERIAEYGFEGDKDYVFCFPNLGSNRRGGYNRKDYYLTLDMAKELAMVERTDKGRQARRYFIECERRLHTLAPPPPSHYHYPKDTAKPYEMFTARQAWLTYPNLFDERSSHPLGRLLRQLREDGHDVEGARLEYVAFKHLAERYYWTLVDIERSAHNARLTGLNVVWEPAPPTPKKR